MKSNIKIILISLVGIFLMSVIALLVIFLANKSRSDILVYGKVPEFSFTERSGLNFGTDEMKGKINIVNFFFTGCKGPCPIMNTRVAELYKKFITTDEVQFVSLSVDPDRDSLKVLKEYAETYGVTDNRWLFTRAPIEEVHRVSEKGFMLAGELPTIHSTKLILVDRDLNTRGYYDSFEEEHLRTLITHVRELLYANQ